MITVHFMITGSTVPLSEQLDLPAHDYERIITELNDRIARADILIDGKHPVVRELFFIQGV